VYYVEETSFTREEVEQLLMIPIIESRVHQELVKKKIALLTSERGRPPDETEYEHYIAGTLVQKFIVYDSPTQRDFLLDNEVAEDELDYISRVELGLHPWIHKLIEVKIQYVKMGLEMSPKVKEFLRLPNSQYQKNFLKTQELTLEDVGQLQLCETLVSKDIFKLIVKLPGAPNSGSSCNVY
jgi:hypothetical protein